MKAIYDEICFPDQELGAFIGESIDYAIGLFRVIYRGWAAMAVGYEMERTGVYDRSRLEQLIRRYDEAWTLYRACAGGWSSLYRDEYLHEPGMGASIDRLRNEVSNE